MFGEYGWTEGDDLPEGPNVFSFRRKTIRLGTSIWHYQRKIQWRIWKCAVGFEQSRLRCRSRQITCVWVRH